MHVCVSVVCVHIHMCACAHVRACVIQILVSTVPGDTLAQLGKILFSCCQSWPVQEAN